MNGFPLRRRHWPALLLLFLWLAGCSDAPAAVAAPDAASAPPKRTPVQLVVPGPTATATPRPAATLTPFPTPTLAPVTVAPPAPFTTARLGRGVRPVTYVENTCEYLRRRWAPDTSQPGTILVPIMYHGVGSRANRGNGDTWTPTSYFRRTMATAKRLGFETVTTQEAVDFLYHNAPIPSRALLLIVDDRRAGTVEQYFLPVLKRNDWTVTLGWIIANTDRHRGLWERMERLNATGLLDVQSHGLRHLYITGRTSERLIRAELFDPIPILSQHFGQRPIAFIWPGGNFTSRSAAIAAEAGFAIAFTAYPRGPILYNWVPLGKAERALDDPLMVLPRYWAYPGMIENLQEAAAIGDAARRQALAAFPAEAAYYRATCGGELGSMD